MFLKVCIVQLHKNIDKQEVWFVRSLIGLVYIRDVTIPKFIDSEIEYLILNSGDNSDTTSFFSYNIEKLLKTW